MMQVDGYFTERTCAGLEKLMKLTPPGYLLEIVAYDRATEKRKLGRTRLRHGDHNLLMDFFENLERFSLNDDKFIYSCRVLEKPLPPTFREYIFKWGFFGIAAVKGLYGMVNEIHEKYDGPEEPPDVIKTPEQLEKVFGLKRNGDAELIKHIWNAYTEWFKANRARAVWE
jgi:hypothetical protein